MGEEFVEVGNKLKGLLDLPQRRRLPETQLGLCLADIEVLVVIKEAAARQGDQLEPIAIGSLLNVDAAHELGGSQAIEMTPKLGLEDLGAIPLGFEPAKPLTGL